MRVFLIVVVLMVSGCAKGQGISLIPHEQRGATPLDFKVCHGFGCSMRSPVELSEQDWADVIAPLKGKAKDAAAERQNIARAVARMEKTVQERAYLTPDRGEATTFEGDQHQMDCLDETINTSRSLAFFEEAGLFEYHDVGEPVHRGYFINGLWPHNSASVVERGSEARYVIDSYYSDNGGEVYVVDLDTWLNAWRPADQ